MTNLKTRLFFFMSLVTQSMPANASYRAAGVKIPVRALMAERAFCRVKKEDA